MQNFHKRVTVFTKLKDLRKKTDKEFVTLECSTFFEGGVFFTKTAKLDTPFQKEPPHLGDSKQLVQNHFSLRWLLVFWAQLK